MPISSGLNNDQIRVGVVLPEDKIKQLCISWTPQLDVSGNLPDPNSNQTLELTVESDSIRVNGSTSGPLVGELTIACDDQVSSISPEYGFHLEPVIAGRGFHWEKQICVDLPGKLVITVQDGQLKVINTLDVETYVACVATSEMGADAPTDLLAAQTVVARCWSMALAEAKHLKEGFDVCNDDCCQRYQGTTYLTKYSHQAAMDTSGEVLVYENRVIDARYSKNCGGMVEAYETVWPGGKVPYLIPLWDAPKQRAGHAVDNFEDLWNYRDSYCSSKRFESVDLATMLGKVDVSGKYYRWEHTISKSDILKNLQKYADQDWSKITDIRIIERGPSSRIKYLFLDGIDKAGQLVQQMVKSEYGIRRMFSDSFLYSSAFVIKNASTLNNDENIILRGVGWGHGVGLCQMGALGMALDRIEYKDILAHYYPGTTFTKI